jgi:cytoskeletal protein CcmA (bactofilin family)
MAFFRDTVSGARGPVAAPHDALQRQPERPAPVEGPRRPIDRPDGRPESRGEPRTDGRESFIGADLTIEGKIEGAGHVRIAGRFKGDVQVRGSLALDAGAHLTGQVRASQVAIGGELHGNIDGAERVELLQTGVLVGDVKAGSLTVAAGSRMRGKVEFGWGDKGAPQPDVPRGPGIP